MARVLTEDWVARNMYCPICGNKMLHQYEANRPVADFRCDKCRNDFELKSKESSRGELGNTINDGQYDKMIERITSNENPNFFFLTHSDYRVNNLILIPKHYFVPSIIIKRKPLSGSARRSGWTGCNIDLTGIPESGKIFIIRNQKAEDMEKVKALYHKTLFLKDTGTKHRGWILDVLMCIEQIHTRDFTLDDVYNFAPQLQAKHPDNNFIHAKIRQQLQYLRNEGCLCFTSRGHYRKL